MESNVVDRKFKNSYKDEYEALFEAIFGECSQDLIEEIISPSGDHKEEQKREELSHENRDEGDDTTWSCLPDLLLERIYSNLTLRQRYYASMVCRNWYDAFHLPNVWRYFVFDDRTLTRRLFNYYSGWQYMLDHLRAQFCLNNIGKHIRALTFRPISNFYNLYEFMNMISFYAEQRDRPQWSVKDIGAQISILRYTFPCNMSSKNEPKLYGTGGKLLDALKRLINNLPSLKTLELVDLMLDSDEALHLLDQLCYSHCLLMKRLILVNISKIPCPLLHAGVFLNLAELTISPHNLHDDVLELLSHTKLCDLNIVQNTYTTENGKTCSSNAWTACTRRNPNLKVHLYIKSSKDQPLVWQDSAPVRTVLFDSPKIKASEETITEAVRRYGKTLKVFGYTSLTRFHQSKLFHDRMDRHLVYLCENCPNLNTLAIREKISTTTALLIAHTAKNLENFYVRRNTVILQRGWPPNLEWSDEVNTSIKKASHSYTSTEIEISSLIGHRWKMLSDREFKNVKLAAII